MASLDLTPQHVTPWQSLLACCRPSAPARAGTREAAAKSAGGPATVGADDDGDVSLGDAPDALYCDDDVPDMSCDDDVPDMSCDDDVPDMAAARDDETPRAAHDAPHVTLYRCMAMLLLRRVFGSWLFGRWRVTKAMLTLPPSVESGTRRSNDADEGAREVVRYRYR